MPTPDHVVGVGNETRGGAEMEIGERRAELGHERLRLRAAPAWRMHGILQQDIGCRELIDDAGVPRIAPELREPATDDGLVLLFLRHDYFLSVHCGERVTARTRAVAPSTPDIDARAGLGSPLIAFEMNFGARGTQGP